MRPVPRDPARSKASLSKTRLLPSRNRFAEPLSGSAFAAARSARRACRPERQRQHGLELAFRAEAKFALCGDLGFRQMQHGLGRLLHILPFAETERERHFPGFRKHAPTALLRGQRSGKAQRQIGCRILGREVSQIAAARQIFENRGEPACARNLCGKFQRAVAPVCTPCAERNAVEVADGCGYDPEPAIQPLDRDAGRLQRPAQEPRVGRTQRENKVQIARAIHCALRNRKQRVEVRTGNLEIGIQHRAATVARFPDRQPAADLGVLDQRLKPADRDLVRRVGDRAFETQGRSPLQPGCEFLTQEPARENLRLVRRKRQRAGEAFLFMRAGKRDRSTARQPRFQPLQEHRAVSDAEFGAHFAHQLTARKNAVGGNRQPRGERERTEKMLRLGKPRQHMRGAHCRRLPVPEVEVDAFAGERSLQHAVRARDQFRLAFERDRQFARTERKFDLVQKKFGAIAGGVRGNTPRQRAAALRGNDPALKARRGIRKREHAFGFKRGCVGRTLQREPYPTRMIRPETPGRSAQDPARSMQAKSAIEPERPLARNQFAACGEIVRDKERIGAAVLNYERPGLQHETAYRNFLSGARAGRKQQPAVLLDHQPDCRP